MHIEERATEETSDRRDKRQERQTTKQKNRREDNIPAPVEARR
jgi:hypothetical protein